MTTGVVFFVEGPDDERFIEQIIRPVLSINNVNTHHYSKQPDLSVDQAIGGFQGMYRELYLLRDFDKGKQGCTSIHDRKRFVNKKFTNIRPDQMIVVKDAVEGWYLAGINSQTASDFGVTCYSSTDNVGKDEFMSELNDSRFTSKKNFQMEIIKNYSIETAKNKNTSFCYFLNRIDNLL